MSIIFRIFVVKINLLQKTIDMHNFYAKIQKSSVMTNFFFGITETKYLHERSE